MYKQKINQIKYLSKYRGMSEIEIILKNFIGTKFDDYSENDLNIIINFLNQDDYIIIKQLKNLKNINDLLKNMR